MIDLLKKLFYRPETKVSRKPSDFLTEWKEAANDGDALAQYSLVSTYIKV